MIIYDKDAAQNTERSYNTPDIARQRLQTLQTLALRSGEKVLDVGCGTGLLSHDMALTVGESGCVLGVDFSNDMLELAAHRNAGLTQIQLMQSRAEQLPVEDNYFDALTCTQTLLYVDDLGAALSEIHRALKPGGRFCIIETDWRGVVLNSSDDALTRKIFAAFTLAVPNPNLPPKLGGLLEKQGFTAIRAEPISIINSSLSSAGFSQTAVTWMAEIAVDYAVISQQQADDWLEDLRLKGEQRDYFFCVNRFQFSGVKR